MNIVALDIMCSLGALTQSTDVIVRDGKESLEGHCASQAEGTPLRRKDSDS